MRLPSVKTTEGRLDITIFMRLSVSSFAAGLNLSQLCHDFWRWYHNGASPPAALCTALLPGSASAANIAAAGVTAVPLDLVGAVALPPVYCRVCDIVAA